MDENRALFRALSLEKLVTAMFIGLITFVAGLNVLVVMTMTVTDKARDIAVLVAMGARRVQIRRIFLLQGLVVGGMGTLLGLIAGYGLSWAADKWRLIPLNAEIYAVPYVPFHCSSPRRNLDSRRSSSHLHSSHAPTSPSSSENSAGRNPTLRMMAP